MFHMMLVNTVVPSFWLGFLLFRRLSCPNLLIAVSSGKLSSYRVIIERLAAVSPYIFANCCSVGHSAVTSSYRVPRMTLSLHALLHALKSQTLAPFNLG